MRGLIGHQPDAGDPAGAERRAVDRRDAEIDDPRGEHQPAAIDYRRTLGRRGGDHAVGDIEVAASLAAFGADDQRIAEVQRRGHAQPSTPRARRVSTSRQAMRTATPIATCSVIAERSA